jgi:tRNA G26 N,N-dimethylase Trm1
MRYIGFNTQMAIRMALLSISTAASKYKRCVKPLLCINASFYVRLFVIIYDSAEDCKKNCLKHGNVKYKVNKGVSM